MKQYNIKEIKDPNYKPLLLIAVIGVALSVYMNKDMQNISIRHDYSGQEIAEIVPTAVEPITYVLDPLEVVRFEDDTLQGIKRVYGKYATKRLNANVEWLYDLCIERDLKPSLVFAVQAKESAWGKSHYCTEKNNCFGYGYTDSGKVGDYEGDNYRDVTAYILEKYMIQGYGIVNAQTMANAGYNFHTEWVAGVNEIEGYFK